MCADEAENSEPSRDGKDYKKNGASGTSDMDGKAARVAETEAGAERIKITSRAQLHRRSLKSFHRLHAIIAFAPGNLRIEPLFSPITADNIATCGVCLRSISA